MSDVTRRGAIDGAGRLTGWDAPARAPAGLARPPGRAPGRGAEGPCFAPACGAAAAPPFVGARAAPTAGEEAGRGAGAAGCRGISTAPSGIVRMPARARPKRARSVVSSPIGLTMQISPALV